MHFYLIGIDYKSASISTRDAIYGKRKSILNFWQKYAACNSAVLITCNRIEIYGIAKDCSAAFELINKFSNEFNDFTEKAYLEHGRERVFAHALRLAVGLESQLKGELQILAQLDSWRCKAGLPKHIRELWDEVILLAKELRISANLNADCNNVAALIYEDIKNKLAGKERHAVTVIGTGKIAELFVKYKPVEAELTFVAHRNFEKARNLAEISEGKSVLLKDLKTIIPYTDILISATSSPHYIVKKELFDNFKNNRIKPLFIYDLASPRDVEPQVSGISGVTLQNLDDLSYVFTRSNESRKESIDLAAGLIKEVLGKVSIYGKIN